MSFVNLMGNDVWSERDIVARTEAMIRSEVPETEEVILSRKMHAWVNGMAIPTAAEGDMLGAMEFVSRAAQVAGEQARADMALLQLVLDHEGHVVRLSQPEVPQFIDGWDGDGAPVQTENPAYPTDQAERQAASDSIAAASVPVLDLVAQRAALRTPEPVEPDPVEPAPEAP